MVRTDAPYLVMGLLDSESIAYAIGSAIEAAGGRVIYAIQNERIRSIFFDRDTRVDDERRQAMDIRYCDVTREDEVQSLFRDIGPLAGIVHSIAFANPRTCLGEEFHTEATDDILQGFHISCVSLATVARHARENLAGEGSIVALTFDTSRVYPFYNWMGVNKSALEALVRALARRHGRDNIRVNAVSSGPLYSKAATKIPGFGRLDSIWNTSSPLPWDPREDRHAVAHAAAFLLGPFAQKITGQVIYVDGGASIAAGELLDFERPEGETAGCAKG